MPPAIPAITFLSSVDSTNNYAMQQIRTGLAKHGMAWFAHEQYAGKGQRNKQWSAAPGENITMSIVLEPTFLSVGEQFQLSAAIALGTFDFFSKYAGDETKIKWPNDIYWRDRKAGGILIENVIGLKPESANDKTEKTNKDKQQAITHKYTIAGIGININQTKFSESLLNPVSLKQITGKSFDAFELAGELYQCILERFKQLRNSGFKQIYEAYSSHLYKIHQTSKFKKSNRVFEATVKSVTLRGKLVLQHSIEEEYDFGEIEWIQ
ncbi:MAG TPA: biotin--[acetyl-CoA-carboxylase] ligase [Chitinophagaceae bacterium]|nr:biotin--[acetyl-CoA-carboxylase] ligase [Chitinophagaceae bacterium]